MDVGLPSHNMDPENRRSGAIPKPNEDGNIVTLEKWLLVRLAMLVEARLGVNPMVKISTKK
jgi:hypothetical protein